MLRIGLDIGGTKTELAALDAGGRESRTGLLDAVDAPGEPEEPVGLADPLAGLSGAAADFALVKRVDARV